MENKKRGRRKNYNSHTIMLAILIGFCILAIIEILFGQAKIRIEKERLALEQQNQQSVQELKDEWNQLKGTADITTDEVKSDTSVSQATDAVLIPDKTVENTAVSDNTAANTNAVSANTIAGVSAPNGQDGDMQIVFLGDSILDNDRDYMGVAGLISEKCNATVYNMSMGGTTAALGYYDNMGFENWESRSLLGVVNAILGNISGDIFEGYRAGEILKECDFSKTDYFVIEYGINDFLSGQIPQSRYLADGQTLAIPDIKTYSGALSAAVDLLQGAFPNAKILLISPHYCQFFNGDTFVGDAYSVNYGYGSLIEFAQCTTYVYEQNRKENVIYFNAFADSGIDAETADEYLEDGIHLSVAGREIYSDCVSRILNGDFRPEE